MISKDDLDAIQKELYPIINLQKKLLNINENEIKSIEEIVSEQTVDKISLRRLLSVLSSLIYARPLKLYLYCQILSFIFPKVKKFFDPNEVASLFDNKSALLILLQANIITSNSIIQKFNNRQFDINFFFPEIESAKKPKNIKALQNDEYRCYGQNDDNIATIIRNDDVRSLSKALKLDGSLLNSTIRPSRYETFDFVKCFGKKPSLIEYSAFFGSVKTFKYLLNNGADASDILPEFAVHGGSIEIIHLLEEKKYLTFGSECLQAAVEFFQYELIDYFISTTSIKHLVFNLFESIKHFNYEIFIELIQNSEFNSIENLNHCLFYSIEYQNIDAINLLLKIDVVDINTQTNFNIFKII